MSITVCDKTIKTVVCNNGSLDVEEIPRRDVTLTGDSVPELPEFLTEFDVVGVRKPQTFKPERVVITYRTDFRDEEGFAFDEVRIVGTNIRKDGSLGERTASVNYWVKIDADLDEVNRKMVMSRAGDYVLPEWLAPYVERFDPLGQENPFTAIA